MKFLHAYSSFFESKIEGRYIHFSTIAPLLETYKNVFKIETIGYSVLGTPIEMLTVGQGKKKVLAWSQMHGNETTTTKAVFDFLSFLNQEEFFQKEINQFIANYTLYVIPMLNPDGAKAYTRENANGIDLNRDAQEQSQPESRALVTQFARLQPDLCLNLHDQRTIYGFDTGKAATVSFLAPSANPERTVTKARELAMNSITKMAGTLSKLIPDQIGRYDDTFNANCVGDTFQMAGVPTILFEAGHAPNDYQREDTRKYICYSLLTLFGFVASSEEESHAYNMLPENKKNYFDVLLRNVNHVKFKKPVCVAVQYREVLEGGVIVFVPYIEQIGDLGNYYGHQEIDVKGAKILVNSQEKYDIGEKVLKIVNKKDDFIYYINGV